MEGSPSGAGNDAGIRMLLTDVDIEVGVKVLDDQLVWWDRELGSGNVTVHGVLPWLGVENHVLVAGRIPAGSRHLDFRSTTRWPLEVERNESLWLALLTWEDVVQTVFVDTTLADGTRLSQRQAVVPPRPPAVSGQAKNTRMDRLLALAGARRAGKFVIWWRS